MIEEQIALETTQVTRGVARYMEHKAKAEERGRDLDEGPVAQILVELMDLMIPVVRAEQRKVRQKLKDTITRGGRLGGWELAFDATPAEHMSYITVRSMLTRVSRNADGATVSERHAVAQRIGAVVSEQFAWDAAQRAERERAKDNPPNRISQLKRTVKEINPRHVRKWLRKLDDLEFKGLDHKPKINLGFCLFDLFRMVCQDYVSIQEVNLRVGKQTRRKMVIDFTPEVRARLNKAHVRRARVLPWMLPMIAKPKDWCWTDEGYVGGYYSTRVDLLKYSMGMQHTAGLLSSDVVPERVLHAVNVVSSTPWLINDDVLFVAEQAIEHGVDEVLPVAVEKDLPPSIPAKEWAQMTREEQTEASVARRMIHDHNNKLRARRDAMNRQLAVAKEFAEFDQIYFPHNLDFRGRMYPIPQDLHPQADDFGRSLLRFATAKPLGHEGFKWLCYHVANTYGMDKESRAAQLEWCLDHLDQLAAVANAPFAEGLDFWSKAEEPWQFLAGCIELDNAFQSGNVYEYASSLPVYVDGSCNGLQHLSAMGLDPVGAAAVNLTPGDRQDIYQIVADKVIWAVENETDPTHGGKTMDNPWRGHVTRKTVKRGVMTVPYGLTDVGMRDQLIQDGMCSGLDGDVMKNATYMRDCMKDAISGTVVAATAIMEWMQDNATILAKNGKGVEWTTPAGLRVRQAYYKTVSKRINTISGTAVLYETAADAPVRVNKQATSIAPNIIHSFDAAHMMLTIEAAGDLSFSVIHDSFGTHAADMRHLGRVLREQFVEMYRHNWFDSLQAEFQAMAGDDVPLIKPPARGDFDIEQVLRSDFFFA